MKYINFKRYKFSTVTKKISELRYNFLKIFKFLSFRSYDFGKIYKYGDFTRFKIGKIYKFFDLRKYDFNLIRKYDFNLIRKINIVNNRFLILHLPLAFVFFGLLYFLIPTFYKYDKSKLEGLLCKAHNIECIIRGKVSYRFYPTPRLKIKDIIINSSFENKKTLITVEDTSIVLSIKNLLAKEKHKYKKIKLNNFEVNLDLKNIKKYQNIFEKKINLLPTKFIKGKMIFFEGKNYVATVSDTNINLKILENNIDVKLKGKFLNDNMHFSLERKMIDKKLSTDLTLKLSNLNFLIKTNFYQSQKDKNTLTGNVLVKQKKNKITGIFDYKDREFIIKKSNLRNPFIDGKMEGKIIILPYFGFDLDLNLNSINFTKLYNHFLSLDENDQKKLFKLNNKINGKINFSSDKIYSNYNLIKSLESRFKFNNGNVHIEQFLLNMGKLGASDILGVINNDKKFTNFKFESNIFVDNKKKFLSKFGIYEKENFPSNFFISGNFDLDNHKATFYEISDNEKLNNEDINFIEKEFNYFMFDEGYKHLFYFPKFKDFVKSITNEIN